MHSGFGVAAVSGFGATVAFACGEVVGFLRVVGIVIIPAPLLTPHLGAQHCLKEVL